MKENNNLVVEAYFLKNRFYFLKKVASVFQTEVGYLFIVFYYNFTFSFHKWSDWFPEKNLYQSILYFYLYP